MVMKMAERNKSGEGGEEGGTKNVMILFEEEKGHLSSSVELYQKTISGESLTNGQDKNATPCSPI